MTENIVTATMTTVPDIRRIRLNPLLCVSWGRSRKFLKLQLRMAVRLGHFLTNQQQLPQRLSPLPELPVVFERGGNHQQS